MKKFIIATAILSALICQAAESANYNVLLFTADDMHAESMESYGGKVKGLMPNLDKFANQGMLFEKAHVNVAICAPSRAVIATGRLSHNSGAMGFMPANAGTPHIVEIFQKAGYSCGILGKVGHSSPVPGTKWDYAFDQKELGNGRSPTIYYERSKTFLEGCKKDKKPFYFMVNSHDPHRPYCNPRKLTKGAEMPSKVYTPEEVEVPGFVPDLPGVRAELAMYQNSTRRLDDTFGKVIQALEETGFADNTLVVFMTDNGIAIPFAKCNVWFHATHSPMIFRLPGLTKAGKRDDTHFISGVDLLPTFLELTDVPAPDKLDGRSVMPLLKGKSQEGRDLMFTQIDSKAGGDAVPMRCVQDAKFGYIYNPFSDGKHRYRNNNEGKTMAAMKEAAKTDPAIAVRVELFRYRVPEEFYDLEKDPNCLKNMIDNPEYSAKVEGMRKKLEGWMVDSNDPMLEAFRNKDDRAAVDKVLAATYKKKNAKPKKKNKKTYRKPNVILIVSDDHGYADFSYKKIHDYIKTPNLDRLITEGVQFTNGYATSPICSPSRCGILTGRQQQRWGTFWYGGKGIPENVPTIAEKFRTLGYRTAYIGKLHYGNYSAQPGLRSYPLEHGFDECLCAPPGGRTHYLYHSEDAVKRFGSAGKMLFVKPMTKNGKKRNYEGFLTENYSQWYDQSIWPNLVNGRKYYAAQLYYMDREIGKLMEHLKKLSLDNDTIVVYTSDNGGSTCNCADNTPLRGTKYTMYEGGIRVPYVLRWPGKLPAGTQQDTMVCGLDFMPTLLAAAGGTDKLYQDCDGVNILPLAMGKIKTVRDALHWDGGWRWAVRKRRWKLKAIVDEKRAAQVKELQHTEPGKGIELYDLLADPGEKNNLAEKHPNIVQKLTTLHQKWRKQIDNKNT